MGMEGRQPNGERRAQSEVVGLSLLMGLVIVSAAFVFAAGSITLDSAQTEIQHDSAEREMVATNSELRDVSAAPVGETSDLPLDQGVASEARVEEDEASITVEAKNDTGGTIDEATFEVGSMTYEDGDTKITSEAGGVWREGETGTTMVSPPSLTRENGSVNFDVVDVRSDADSAEAAATKSNFTRFIPDLNEVSDRPPVDVVLVADESGSMDDNDPNDLRLRATDQFIGDIDAEEKSDRIATVHASLWGAHQGADCVGSNQFSPRDTDARVVNDLTAPDQVSASRQPDRCGTNYHAGLQEAVDILEEQSSEDRRKVIVFMGDGEHLAIEQYGAAIDQYEYDERPTAANTRRLAAEAEGRDISIHTIGFSEGLNAPGERLLQDMTTNDGSYRFAEDPEDLEPVFEDIFEDITEEQPPAQVRIEVKSQFADAWEEYLRQEFDTVDRLDDSTVAVTVDTSQELGADAISITVSEVRVGR